MPLTHKQRCEYALRDLDVTYAMREAIYNLIAHAMQPTREQPSNLLLVLCQLAMTASLDETLPKPEARKALRMYDALAKLATSESDRKQLFAK